ncbi:MAG TPA: hypothetical protein VMU04_24770 [Candidatus Acidoferrum sp.]|nr:hypothetical protein [Candidatus Acidoferrum sp.]
MQVTIKNGIMNIAIPVSETPAPSKTGKTLVVATTHGNVVTSATINGKPVTIGLNAYIRSN